MPAEAEPQDDDSSGDDETGKKTFVSNTYVFPDKSIPVVHLAFERLGIEYQDGGWDAVSNSDDWTVCWSWRFTQFRYMQQLTKQHRVNHLPGTYSMLMKSMLYSTLEEMNAQHGERDFPRIMPRQYLLPQNADAFKEAYEELKNRPVDEMNKARAARDPLYRKRWLIKAQSHRGIKFFAGMHELPQIMNNRSMVAEYIEPLLVGGYKFDFAVYVALTSIDPLRIYVFDIPKVRFCRFPYPKILDEHVRQELSYVVTQIFLPPWQIPALKKYYNEKSGGCPTNTDPGTNDMDVMKRWMDENGLDGNKFEQDIIASIIKIVSGNRHKFTEGLDFMTKKWDKFHADPSNFFEMWRFDFIVDDEGKTFITEVNQSPNMIVYNFTTDHTSDQVLKQEVIHNLLDMVTAGSAPLPPLPSPDEDYCNKNCIGDDISEDEAILNVACWACEGSDYDEHEIEAMHRAILEYSNRGRYKLVYPEIRPMGQDPPFSTFLNAESDADRTLSKYFAALGAKSPPDYDVDEIEIPMVCFDRAQCHNQGDCIDGRCVCDKGFAGTVCNRRPRFNQKWNVKPKKHQQKIQEKNSSHSLMAALPSNLSFKSGLQDQTVEVGVLAFVAGLLVATTVAASRNRRIRRNIFRKQKSDEHMV